MKADVPIIAIKTDWVAIVVNIAVPMVVMFVTLFYSNYQQKKSERTLNQRHIEILNVEQNKTRLSVLPFFDVISCIGKREVIFEKRDGEHYIIDIQLKNVGNGAAFGMHIEWRDVNDELIYYPVYENDFAIYSCYKEIQLENTIATIGKQISLSLLRKSKAVELQQEGLSEEPLVLKIMYEDSLGNKYCQSIAMRISKSVMFEDIIEGSDIIPFMPNLI